MDLSDQLFLVLCRLRNGLHVKDLAYRFNIKQQSVSLIFKSMVHYMHLKLSYLSYWPKRDVMIKNMPLK
jgi:DNA-binding NarL/FixJ family response regulator